MGKIIGCSLIVKDNFNNVLVIQRKAKKNEPKIWQLVSKKRRGKEDLEKTVSRAAKEDLKSILFDLEEFDEVSVDSQADSANMIFTAIVKERMVYHKDIVAAKWINKKDVNSIELLELDRNILNTYFQ